MCIFRRRPLALLALFAFLFFFVGFALLGRAWETGESALARLPRFLGAAAAVCGALFLLPLGGLFFTRRRPGARGRAVLSTLALALAGGAIASLCLTLHCSMGSLREPLALAASGSLGEPLPFEGEIGKISSTAYSSTLDLTVTRVSGRSCRFAARLVVPAVIDGEAGELISGRAAFSLPEESENGFPARQYHFSRGVFLTGEVPAGAPLTSAGESRSLAGALSRLRDKLSSILERNLPPDDAALLEALLLGDRESLPGEIKRDFQTYGISHLLAVSGLHLSVLCGVLALALSEARCPKKARLPLLAAFCLFFMGLCGFSGSVCRAGVMLLFSLLAPLCKTRQDSLTGLFGGGLLILLFSPWRIFDTGLQLSFLAVLGILTLGKALNGAAAKKSRPREASHPLLAKVGKALRSSFSASVSAIIFTFPVVATLGTGVALLSPLATLLLSPVVEGLLLTSPLALLFSALPGVSDFLFFLSRLLGDILLYLSSGAVHFAKTVLPLAPRAAAALAGGFLLVLLFFLVFKLPQKFARRAPLFLFALLLAGNALFMRSAGGGTRALYVCSGSNEAFLLSDKGETVLIDLSAGTSGASSLALNRERELPAVGVDALLLTHLHARHRSQLSSLSEDCYLKRLILPTPRGKSEEGVYSALVGEARARGIAVIPYERGGGEIPLTKSVRFTPAPATALSRSTHPALAFRLDRGSLSLLYAGCSFPAAVLPTLDPESADLLVLGRHGPVRRADEDTSYAPLLGSPLPAVLLADETYANAADFPRAAHLRARDYVVLDMGG